MTQPRTRRKEARPQEIVRAALHLFAQRGFAATRLDDVALQAGISKGTLYLYFENKEALFRAVVEESVLPNIEAFEQMIGTYDGPTPDLLRRMIDRFGQIVQSEVGCVPKIVISEAGNFPAIARYYADTVIKRGLTILTFVLQRGMDRGEFRQVDIPQTLPLIVAPFLMMAQWQHSLAPHVAMKFNPTDVLSQHFDFLLRALAVEKHT
ncbi:TetR/AcrR family transcriptional regulator [Roseiterribacter gracilis]|uniref:TetR family transcriptional regulator n=1 Tax=Roseiterribacter gracilis TaxID=2812848 RepID=A0A8S8XAF2_9PROT|nr:TetR family transcriptional regulator [Rhodospirillales bacterium TMPK1]